MVDDFSRCVVFVFGIDVKYVYKWGIGCGYDLLVIYIVIVIECCFNLVKLRDDGICLYIGNDVSFVVLY